MKKAFRSTESRFRKISMLSPAKAMLVNIIMKMIRRFIPISSKKRNMNPVRLTASSMKKVKTGNISYCRVMVNTTSDKVNRVNIVIKTYIGCVAISILNLSS
jgi:hypothetical protein